MVSLKNFYERVQHFSQITYLAQRHVKYKTLPVFEGEAPDFLGGGEIYLGRTCHFRSFRLKTVITAFPDSRLEIEDCVYMNDGVNICCSQYIHIGSYTKIADHVIIYDTDFHAISPEQPIRQQPVHIGRNVWLGARAIILPGVTIGDHAVIGAGAVVTSAIPARCVAAGNPAKVLKTFDCPNDWVRD